MNLPTIQEIKTKDFFWIDISRCSPEEMKHLEQKFGFHPVHLNDCLSTLQRPKLDVTEKYIFMVLLFPIYNRKTRKVTSSEIDFFINSDYLITVHRGELSSLINFFNSCKISDSQQKKYFSENPSALIRELLSRLFSYCLPILDTLSLNITSIENHIFQGYEKKMVKEILISKTNIVNFRKIMQAHRLVVSKLLKKSNIFFSTGQFKIYFDELLETIDDIWGNLENLKQSIEATEKTNNSLISFQLNDVIKILTTISVVILPITLIATIFGMNLQFMPLSNNPSSFWIIILIMVIIFSGLVYYFKKKKWL
ncbi:magnesium transporter CorA family protein [Patescibacteria group bacterium]|nr:magnesium transporter CorA family protein [Patescibacteria group bacterium]